MIMRNTMDNGPALGEPDLEPHSERDLEQDGKLDSALEGEPDSAPEGDLHGELGPELHGELHLEPRSERDLEQHGEPEPHGEPDRALEEPSVPAPGLRMNLEAVLLVADEPVPEGLLAEVTGQPEAAVAVALRDLAAGYTAEQRGFDLREVAGGWRLYTRDECAAVVERFVSDGQEIRLTQAALETLAVVAYRQPVSRARVSAVRGVNCDGVMRTLVLRGLVEEAGNDPETGAILFQTTSYFLERLGLARLSDLPDLTPFLPDHLDEELDFGHDASR
jgi:segregation and condensation protein B